MKFIYNLFVFFALVALALGYPAQKEEEEFAPGPRLQRQAGGGGHHHDVVDFGAHTGDHGAFGWYADFPVHSH